METTGINPEIYTPDKSKDSTTEENDVEGTSDPTKIAGAIIGITNEEGGRDVGLPIGEPSVARQNLIA